VRLEVRARSKSISRSRPAPARSAPQRPSEFPALGLATRVESRPLSPGWRQRAPTFWSRVRCAAREHAGARIADSVAPMARRDAVRARERCLPFTGTYTGDPPPGRTARATRNSFLAPTDRASLLSRPRGARFQHYSTATAVDGWGRVLPREPC
jgi:hypothetical protein